MSKPSLHYLMETNDKSEKLAILFMKICVVFAFNSTTVGLIFIVYKLINDGHFNPDSLAPILLYNYVYFNIHLNDNDQLSKRIFRIISEIRWTEHPLLGGFWNIYFR